MASVLLTVALALIALLAIVIVVSLLVPIRVNVEIDVGTGGAAAQSVQVAIRWLRFEWAPRTGGPRDTDRLPQRRSGRRRPGRAKARARALLGTRGFARHVVRLVLDLLHLLLPQRASGVVRIGADDPMVTGVFFGAAQALYALAPSNGWHVQVEPDFTQSVFTARGRLEWVLRPVAIARPLAAFLFSLVTIKAAIAAFRTA